MRGMKGITSMSGWGRIAGGAYRFAEIAAADRQRLQDTLKKQQNEREAAKFPAVSGAAGEISGLDTKADTFMRHYTEVMNMVKAAAQRMFADCGAGAAVSSSDPAVAEASARWQTAAHANYMLAVQQIAQTQKNSSHGWRGDAENTLALCGSLRILTSFGGVSVELGDYAGERTNAGVLEKVAEKINAANVDVIATAQQDQEQVSLQIEAGELGAASEFVVSGTFAEFAGVNTAATVAQDAVYQVNGRTVVSDSNEVNLDDYRITARLKAVGTTVIRVGADSSLVVGDLENLSETYNHALQFLSDYCDMGTGVLYQLQNMLRISVPEQALRQMGVTVSKNGTLHVDRQTFLQQYTAVPQQTEAVLSGLAAKLYSSATQGLDMPSRSLVDRAENLSQWRLPFSGVYGAVRENHERRLSQDFSAFVDVQI